MPQIAGLRGVLPEPSKLREVVAETGFDVAKGLAAGTLVRDPGRAVYRYHQVFSEPGSGRTLVRKMFLCAVRLEPWNEGLVKPHEAALPEHKAAALAALQATRLQAAPVFAGYRDAASEVERLFRRVDGERPTCEVTTRDRTVHRLWRVQSAELLGQLRHVFAPKKLTVLEGHAAYEALLAYRDELAARQPLAMYSSANYGLMCLANIDDPALIVVPRHRLLHGGGSSQAALAAARRYFIIEKLAGAGQDLARQRAALADTVAHQPAFVVAWAGEPDAWKLTLSPEVSPVQEGVQVDRALHRLAPIVADQLFAERVLTGARLEALAGGEDPLAVMTGPSEARGETPEVVSDRSGEARDGRKGMTGPSEARGETPEVVSDRSGEARDGRKEMTGPSEARGETPEVVSDRSGEARDGRKVKAKADAVVVMAPMAIEQINHLAEIGQVVPTGSSAFHPRFAPGLVAAAIDPDEDLV